MEDITYLPHVTFLTISVIRGEHIFGASLFHVLRLCTRIKKLSLNLQLRRFLKEHSPCQPGCYCEQPTNWKTEELLLDRLREADVSILEGCEDEIVFLKLLFNWAPVLEKMTIFFDISMGYSKAMELCQTISSFSRPEICVKFYMYDHAATSTIMLQQDEFPCLHQKTKAP
ncbi:hypothetical protein QOZ80_7AG0553170 [Eleusine coracana subsp. coracana]|nr:hypothetical protein QOZ80_7AG0553170 [Eleusine coracana subsp. coracana]